MPTTHETSLDLTLIEAVSQFAAPQVVTSDWVVRIDTHYLGGGRHFGEWEVADIGFIVVLRESGQVTLRKVAILQSKRLYPDEQNLEEDTPLDYMIGFARLMQGDDSSLAAEQNRVFSFSERSRYRAFVVNDDQYKAIKAYETRHKIPVHYLLHHPLRLPWSQHIPITPPENFPDCTLGATVVRAKDVRSCLKGRDAGYTPTYDDLAAASCWPLDTFVADELLRCREGYRAETPDDPGLFQVFNRRTGPIAAAIAITIDHAPS